MLYLFNSEDGFRCFLPAPWGLTAQADSLVHDVRSFGCEKGVAFEAVTLVAGWNSITPNIGFEALQNFYESVDLVNDSDWEPAPDARAVASAIRDSQGQAYRSLLQAWTPPAHQ